MGWKQISNNCLWIVRSWVALLAHNMQVSLVLWRISFHWGLPAYLETSDLAPFPGTHQSHCRISSGRPCACFVGLTRGELLLMEKTLHLSIPEWWPSLSFHVGNCHNDGGSRCAFHQGLAALVATFRTGLLHKEHSGKRGMVVWRWYVYWSPSTAWQIMSECRGPSNKL